jgi:hypothetical protein
MMRHRWVFGAVGGALLGWQTQSDATIVRAIPLDEIVKSSEEVVVATVIESKSHYASVGGYQRMVTDATLLIDHVVLANRTSTTDHSQTVTVRRLGGTADGLAHVVFGEAALTPNATFLLFLRLGSDGTFWVSAMAQGEYQVRTDEEGAVRLARSTNLDTIVDRGRSVVTSLDGATLKQAESLVASSASKVKKLP